MTDHQREQLLTALMYYLPMDIRQQIARELPEAYAAYNRVHLAAIRAATVEHERIRTARKATVVG